MGSESEGLSARRLRVLNVLFDGRLGGPQRRVIAVAQELRDRGVDTIVLVPALSRPLIDFALERGIELRVLDFATPAGVNSASKLLRYGFLQLRDVIRFRRLIHQLSVDIVHVNGALFLAPAIATRFTSAKLVWHLNDTLFRRSLSRVLGTVVNCLSHVTIAAARRVAEHHHVRQTVVIPAPVDISVFFPRPFVPRLPPLVIGVVGNWSPVKGHDLCIAALHRLAQKGVPFQVRFVGAVHETQKEFRHECESLISDYGLSKNVVDLGFSSMPSAEMSLFDILALPSRSEASPTVVLEAMAIGVPVVAFDVGGVKDMVHSEFGCAGLIVPSGDVTALSDAILTLWSDSSMYSKMAVVGPQIVKSRFTIGTCADRHVDAYCQAVMPKAVQ